MLINIFPSSDKNKLCLITFCKCSLCGCRGCWERHKKIVISPVINSIKGQSLWCQYVKPVKYKEHGFPGSCRCRKFLSVESKLITAIQLLGYAK